MSKIKDLNLAHYSEKEPKEFLQIDGWNLPDGGDDVMIPNKDGDVLTEQRTIELMKGAYVRVMIPADEDVNPHTAARLLRMIADHIDWNVNKITPIITAKDIIESGLMYGFTRIDLEELKTDVPNQDNIGNISFTVNSGNCRMQRKEEENLMKRIEEVLQSMNMKMIVFRGMRTGWKAPQEPEE